MIGAHQLTVLLRPVQLQALNIKQSRGMTTMRKTALLSRLNYITIGLTVGGIALCLIHDRSYFFWPPQWVPFLNDIRIGTLGLIIGLGLIIYGLVNHHSNWWAGILLGLNAAFTCLLIVAELAPVVFDGYYRWHIGSVLLIFLLMQIMIVAYYRNTEH